MTLRVGESGKTFRVAAGFDMSNNTELTLTFTLPDSSTVTKTKSGGDVILGTATITDDDLGELIANQYVIYEIDPGFLTQSGAWYVRLTYTNTVPDPDDIFEGTCGAFTVTGVTCGS